MQARAHAGADGTFSFPYDFSEQANLTAPAVRTMAAVLNCKGHGVRRDSAHMGDAAAGNAPDCRQRARRVETIASATHGRPVCHRARGPERRARRGLRRSRAPDRHVRRGARYRSRNDADARPGAVRIARRIVARDARGPANFRLGDARERASAPGKRSRERGLGAINEPLGRLRAHNFGIIQRSACPVISI